MAETHSGHGANPPESHGFPRWGWLGLGVALAALLLFASLQPVPEPNVVLAFATASNEGCFGGVTTYNYSFTIVNRRGSDVRVGLELYVDNASEGISYFYLRPRSSLASWMSLSFPGCDSHYIRGNLTQVQDIPSTWMPTSASILARYS